MSAALARYDPMKTMQKIAVFCLLLALLSLTGCKKKKPNVPPPPPPPAITETAPPPQQPTTAQTEQPTTAEVQPPAPVSKPKPPPKKRPPAHKTNTTAHATTPQTQPKPAAQPPTPAPGTRTTVSHGGTEVASVTISPRLRHDITRDQQQSTEELMRLTDENLKAINRQLSNEERAVLQQINSYIDQAKKAMNDQDLLRAHNLALKAHLLSDDLVK